MAVCLTAAACSSSPTTGQVGSTLAAMDGTVTLVKVISPAPVAPGSPRVAAPGHSLVAVVLTVHSPSGSAAKFAAVYNASKLIDSKKLVHIGRSTARYRVAECLGYASFGTLGAGRSMTGCEVFQLSAAAIPVELKISGKSKAQWTISATDIQPGTAGALGTVPKSTLTPTTVRSGLASASGATTKAPTSTAAGTGTTTTGAGGAVTTTAATAPAHHAHRRLPAKAVRIQHLSPRGGRVGSKVQILGKGFSGVTQVTIDGIPAVITKSTGGKIVAVVPAGAATGPIVVSTAQTSVTSSRNFIVY